MSIMYKILNLETGEYLKSPVFSKSWQIELPLPRGYYYSSEKNWREAEEDSIFSCELAAEEFLESWRLKNVKVLTDEKGITREKKPHRNIFEIVPVEI